MLVSAADGTLDGEEYTRDARTCVGLKTGKNDAYLHGRGLHEPGRAPKHGAGRGSGFRASLGRVITRPALSSSVFGTPNGPTSQEDDDSGIKVKINAVLG